MDSGRIIWIASMAAAVMAAIFPRTRKKLSIFLALYGTFMYGFLVMAAGGGFESKLIVLILAINAAAAVLAALWLRRSRKKRAFLIAPALLLIIALASAGVSLPLAEEAMGWDLTAWLHQADGELSVHFIDVGQGDSILILGPNCAVLIDAGERSAGSTVVQYLRDQRVTRLDLVIATHAHADHIGGLVEVLTEFAVAEVMDPGVAHTSRTFEDYLDIIEEKRIPFTEARAGMQRELGNGIRLDIFHPDEPLAASINNTSVVAVLRYGKTSFLFTGDAEAAAEGEILNRGYQSRVDVLKVGHHGSSSSSSLEFLQTFRPGIAVISLGTNNSYGHPHREAMERLDSIGAQVYRTDLHGTVVVTSDGSGITVFTSRQPQD